MITVSSLFIYPIKSLGGISLDSAEITERGIKYDRRWMLVDEKNTFMNQREFPAMALFKVSIFENSLVIQFNQRENVSLQVPLEPEAREFTTVEVWGNHCKAQWVSRTADEFFSNLLQTTCRLVYMPDDSRRKVDERYAHNNEITSFTDGYPILMIGQSSLDDLNSRMDDPLPMNRFRPNIVFTGGDPYEEDLFENFTIGTLAFSGAKLCERCTITTVDQQSAVKGKEPLKTLATYRFKNNKIFFGQNLLHQGKGVIKTGDQINIIKRKKSELL